MKRSPLKRKTGLTRKRPLSSPPPVGMDPPGREARKTPASPPRLARKRMQRPLEPGEAEWKKPRSGICGVCNRPGRILWHHVVDKQTLRKLGRPKYDPQNALPIGAPFSWGGHCRCHDEHENVAINDRRIPYAKIPEVARRYAVEVLGEGPAYEYFRRNYR